MSDDRELAQELALRTPKHGKGKLLIGGVRGHRGGTGRRPGAFLEICRGLASADETIAAVRAILSDASHPAFIGALKWASENGYGKAQQSVDLTSGGERIHYVMRVPDKAPDSATWVQQVQQHRLVAAGKQR